VIIVISKRNIKSCDRVLELSYDFDI